MFYPSNFSSFCYSARKIFNELIYLTIKEMFPNTQLKYFHSPTAQNLIISLGAYSTLIAIKICNCLSLILIANLYIFTLLNFFLYASFSIPVIFLCCLLNFLEFNKVFLIIRRLGLKRFPVVKTEL